MCLPRAVERLLAPIARLIGTLRSVWRLARELLGAFIPAFRKKRKLRPWMIVRRTAKLKQGVDGVEATEDDVRKLLERMRSLEDLGALNHAAVGFRGAGEDYLADSRQLEAMVTELVRQNPPFLHIAREFAAPEEGPHSQHKTEYIVRETDVVVTEPVRLLIPTEMEEVQESRRPPGYPVVRYAKSLSDLRAAPLLYQTMPEDLLIARLVEGSVPLLAYNEDRRYLMFKPEERIYTHSEHRVSRVPVEIESDEEGTGGRLMYMLFDRSMSLVRACEPRGINAVMELAIAVAMARADLGREYSRYYFRTFADKMAPLPQDPPLMARTVAEKDDLVRKLFQVNFSGEATRVVEALDVAISDIERMIESGEHAPAVIPHIALLTDGRFTLHGDLGVRLKRLGIQLDTVLIGREAAHNSDLVRISTSVTAVDPELYFQAVVAA